MRFIKLKGESHKTTMSHISGGSPYFNGSRNPTPVDNKMEVENDFLKIESLEYPTQSQDAARASDDYKAFKNRMKLKMLGKTRQPCNDVAKQFFDAIRSNNISKVIQLIRFKKHDPNVFDSRHRTPLLVATAAGHYHICEYLLENGAEPNRADLLGNTPLHLAATTSRIPLVNLLLKNGADCNLRDCSGLSPLQLASSKLEYLKECIEDKPNEERLLDMKKKCQDIISMIDLCLCEKNLFSLQLQEFKAQIREKIEHNNTPKEDSKDTAKDLETDVTDILKSIHSLTIS